MTTDPHWRAMAESDLDGVAEIQAIAFPDHFEDRDCFVDRLTLYPAGCRVLVDGDDRVLGYGVAYPWLRDAMPPLNARIGALPDAPHLLYLHDLALSPGARGTGAARSYVAWLVDHARAEGWAHIALVAVNDAAPFWARHGFVASDGPALREKLASYGDDARYMVRDL